MEGDQLIIRDLKTAIGDGLSARRGAIPAITCLPIGWFGATLLVSEERPAMQLKLNTRKLDDGIVVVVCSGRIVFGEETSELRERVKALISQGSRVVLNLGEVTYIDSGGV